MKYLVLDEIAYYEAIPDKPNSQQFVQTSRLRTASAGEVVELTDKDAAALLKRGAIKPAK